MPNQQSLAVPFTCRMKPTTGQCLPGEEFCAFEFSWCEGCQKSSALKARTPEDPMKSIIWRGWISGIAAIRKLRPMANERAVEGVIQVMETAPIHERTLAMNEALMLGSLRLHEANASIASLNVQLHAEIKEREQRERDALMLTNELAHRIKNNLQIIVALIGHEAKSAAAPCIPGYKAMQARIGAIAELYDLISQTSRGETVAVDAYLREIARTMSESLLGGTSAIKIDVKAEVLDIDPGRAVPFGLLVNELGTNAIKHAFPDGAGRVLLSVEQIGDQIELTVADNGVGIKRKDATALPEKHGSDYVAIFVRQLGGTIAVSPSEGSGTTVRVRLPLLAASGLAPRA